MMILSALLISSHFLSLSWRVLNFCNFLCSILDAFFFFFMRVNLIHSYLVLMSAKLFSQKKKIV